jgi:hypothetical protein
MEKRSSELSAVAAGDDADSVEGAWEGSELEALGDTESVPCLLEHAVSDMPSISANISTTANRGLISFIIIFLS